MAAMRLEASNTFFSFQVTFQVLHESLGGNVCFCFYFKKDSILQLGKRR